MKSMMSIYLFCFAVFISQVLSDRPMKLQVIGQGQCIVNVSDSYRKQFNNSLENGIKVFYFQVHYNSKLANYLTRSIPDDHFANPNEYMWLYDGELGLPIYMNAPYDFELLSMFILKEYRKTLTVHMEVSESCNENNVSRMQFLRLVFQQLIQIVAKAHLPDKKASAYICYDINNRKKLSDFSFNVYKHLGINRKVLLRYCCQMKNIRSNDDKISDLCVGKEISSSKTLDLQNYVGAFLFAFLPIVIGFISGAKMPWVHTRFAYIRSISDNFDKGDQFVLPFGTESCWISENDNHYNIYSCLKWIFLFNHPSLKASRIRRSMAVFSSLLVLLATLLFHLLLKKQMNIYLDNNIPLGFISIMFGYERSGENTDYFFGGPVVWFSAFVILGLFVINIPDRLCETIAYSFLHQPRTCTFLIQDINLLKCHGGLNVSNLHDYDLLYAILKASLLTALNPSFWSAVIKQWFHRSKKIYDFFNTSQILNQLIGVCVTIPCVFINVFLCASELLLSVIFYCCPLFLVWKAIPHSYIWRFIWPFFRQKNSAKKIFGFLLFIISWPVFLFLFLFNTYLFLTSFQLLSAYVIYIIIALIAKPDAIAYVLLILVLFYFVVSIVKSVSETYQSLLKVSIKLADSVCENFVYTRLDETFIYVELFERIVEQHHPIRYEVAKALTKLLLALCLFVSCVYSFENINLNLSTYIKIVLIILTSMIPKITTVFNDTVLESRWKIERLLETIYDYKRINFDPNNINEF